VVYMRTITDKEMEFAMKLLKNPGQMYSANALSKEIGITSMGALKIGNRLIKEGILHTKQIGKGKYYQINKEDSYTQNYFSLILAQERISASAYAKRWVLDLQKVEKAEIIVLFGSVLKHGKKANDIDVLIIVEKNNFKVVQKQIDELNKLSSKKIHPVYQTIKDFKENVKKDKVIQNAIKGLVVKGEKEFILGVVQ
jgi:predicted nucleotidyltransferase